jgi:hypothetical protein
MHAGSLAKSYVRLYLHMFDIHVDAAHKMMLLMRVSPYFGLSCSHRVFCELKYY